MSDTPQGRAEPGTGAGEGTSEGEGEGGSPLDRLNILAMQSVPVAAGLDHLEIYTMEGLLTVLWHGEADLDAAVVCLGGAMGGLLGPDGGLFHRLGVGLSGVGGDVDAGADRGSGIGVLRVSYRRPNDLASCVHDALAMMELAARHGAKRFVTIGHSFGGAVAVQAAAHLDRETVPGVVTLATQSAGCEPADQLGDRDLLLFHGTADQILPFQASEMVRMLAETGELVLLDGADHLLAPAGDEIYQRLIEHLPVVLADR